MKKDLLIQKMVKIAQTQQLLLRRLSSFPFAEYFVTEDEGRDFYTEQYKSVAEELSSLNTKISDLNKKKLVLSKKLHKIEKNLSDNFQFTDKDLSDLLES